MIEVTKENSSEKQGDGKRIIEKLALLKYEIQHDRRMTLVSLPFCRFARRLGASLWLGGDRKEIFYYFDLFGGRLMCW